MMAYRLRAGDLEIDQDLSFQQRSWQFQRIGWVIMAGVIIFALFGFFGGSVLSRALVGDENSPLQLAYERFLRFDAPTQLRFRLNSDTGSPTKITFNQDYLAVMEIVQVLPEPESVNVSSESLIYNFDVEAFPSEIIFYMKPEQIGVLSGEIRMADETPLSFSQFVYP